MKRNPSNAGYIAELLQTDRTPLLPFEGKALVNRFMALGNEQQEMGPLLREAMVQGAENWDDNAPVDVINRDALVRVAEADRIIEVLRRAAIVGYPIQADHVTLGSLVGVRFGRTSDADPMLLTGVSREMTPEIADLLPKDTEIVTIASPLGRALLGGLVEGEVNYVIGQRAISAQIASIDIPAFPDIPDAELSLPDDSEPRIMKRPPPSWQSHTS